LRAARHELPESRDTSVAENGTTQWYADGISAALFKRSFTKSTSCAWRKENCQ
jgi:hypothetical protein